MSSLKSLKLITPYFIENRRKIVLGLFFLVGVDFLQLLIPRVIKWAIDDLVRVDVGLWDLFRYALYIVGLALGIGILRYGWRKCLFGTSRKIEEGLRNRLFAHIQILSASYFDKTKTGDIMAHATNDVMHVRMATGMGIVALTDGIVLSAAAIGFMAYINVSLTLYALIPMPFIILSTRFFSRKMHRRYGRVQASFSDLTEVVRERFAGIRMIKAHQTELQEFDKVQAISRDYLEKNLALIRITGSFYPMMVFFSDLSMVIVFYLGGSQTIATTITPGDFVAFISYIGMLTWPMMAMGWVTNLISRGRASLDRIDAILDQQPEIKTQVPAIDLPAVKGEVVFEKVSFTYSGQTVPALSDIDLCVKPGTVLGIAGPPGSGKTTLLGLIPRLYDVTSGRILVDGHDIKQTHLAQLRSYIAFMSQEPFLFNGTVAENIDFTSLDEQKMLMAVQDVAMDKDLELFPNGYDTLIGEKGIMLSGGQKQRMAMARCLVKDSPIMIFDDPVSQVDMATGVNLIHTLKNLTPSKTIFIVSHRISALRFADHIIVLDRGNIIEQGTHEKLMQADRYYAKTYQMQVLEEV